MMFETLLGYGSLVLEIIGSFVFGWCFFPLVVLFDELREKFHSFEGLTFSRSVVRLVLLCTVVTLEIVSLGFFFYYGFGLFLCPLIHS